MALARKQAAAAWESEMRRLFDCGYYAEAAALYDERSAGAPVDSVLLRARLDLRADFSRALERLNDLRVPARSAAAVRRDVLLGEAYALGRDYEAADERFDAALRLARSLRDDELAADVGFHIGRRFVMAGDLARAREGLEIARLGTSLEARLDALHLESSVALNDPAALYGTRSLVELLRSIDPNSPARAEHRAINTHALAARAREFSIPDVTAEIERQLLGVPWPPAFAGNRFQTLKALGWTKALRGDYFNAFRLLKESTKTAPTDAWRTMAFCDRAYLASAIGEARWARQELLEAEELAARVAWESCRYEESVALLLIAELYAPIDPARASAYLAQYRRIGETIHSVVLLRGDLRQAYVDYSSGIVDAALGNRKLAVSRLTAALRTFRESGFEWRAGRCALRLYDLTRKPQMLATAEECLRDYSASWLGDELRERRTARAGVALSPMRERVFRLICEGRSNEEIAAIVGRSKATVANHAKAVLKRYGVSSRSALIAEAMKRGVL